MKELKYPELTAAQHDSVSAAAIMVADGDYITDYLFLVERDDALDAGMLKGYRVPTMFQLNEAVKWGPPCYLDGTPMPEESVGAPKENAAVKAKKKKAAALDETVAAAVGAAPFSIAAITMIPRGQIAPAGLNPRTHFDEQRIADLRASMKKRGFDPAFPLIVRPSAQTSGTFEIAAGERRWRAAGEEGIAEIPCSVRELSDREMLETALMENLQHETMTALEEALGYARLIAMGDTLATIAATIGRSEQHIGQRVSLAKLAGTPAGEALERGDLTPSHGRLLAKVPSAALRDELLAKVLKPSYGPGPMPVAELEKKIKLDYMIELRGAKFDQADATLVAMVQNEATGERVFGGACGDCPLRELVSTASRVQLCMNPECFRAKETAAFEKWRVEVTDEAKGRTALPAEDNARLWNHTGRALAYHSPYVELDESPEAEELKAKVTDAPHWKKLIKGRGVPVIVGRDADGKVHELAERTLALEAARENEKDKPAAERIFRAQDRQQETPSARESDHEHKARVLAEQAAREAEGRIMRAKAKALLQAVKSTKKFGRELWDLLMPPLFDLATDGEDLEALLLIFGVSYEGDVYANGAEALRKEIRSAPPEHLPAIALLLMSTCVSYDEIASWQKQAFKAFHVDVKAAEKAERAQIAAEEKQDREQAEIAHGVSWSQTKTEPDDFTWDDQRASNPDVAALAVPGAKVNAFVAVARIPDGWWVTGWEVSETKKKGRKLEEACLANGTHYDSRALAFRTGLLAVRGALGELGRGEESQARLNAYIAAVEVPPIQAKRAKGAKKKK